MQLMKTTAVLAAIAAGMLLPAQAGINGQLGRAFGKPLWAALVSFSGGLAALALVIALGRIAMPSAAAAQSAPWWAWVGGALGAIYVTLALTLAPVLGATTLIVAVFAGQLAGSLVLDQWGLLGFPVHPIDLRRVGGVVLVVLGLLLVHGGKR